MTAAPASAHLGLRRPARVWYATAALGLGAFAAYTLLGAPPGLDDLFNRWLYNALMLLALAACAVRTARVRAERGAWLVFSLAVGSWAVGEILFDFVYRGDPPYPSVADGFYLAFYPGCYVALLLLLRARLSGFTHRLWLDGATAALASGALGASILFEVVVRSTHGSTEVIVTNLAYPLGDILLLSAVAGILGITGWRADRTWLLVAAGIVATTVADGVFLLQVAAGSYVEGTVLDALWPASLLLLSAAAWQTPRGTPVTLAGRPLVGTPLAGGLIGLGTLVVDHFRTLNLLAVGLAVGTIAMVMVRTFLTFRENSRVLGLLRSDAVTDLLTGLGNRRRLMADLEQALAARAESEPRLLVIFDLDGFKLYNDAFGHPAGDALLAKLAANLAAAVVNGSCYRLGGDEFCVLATVPADEVGMFLDSASAALTAEGEGFVVTSSFGAAFVPEEALTPSAALRLGDQRLYAQKRRRSERGHPHELLLQALYEREPDLREHVQTVREMACAVGEALGLSAEEVEDVALAARLHDVGKLAIPDAVLQKPGPLDDHEQSFIREHPVIGERLLSPSPALRRVARIVRSTHERWDGAGYPDRLSGSGIPLASRIIAVCDAFSAMTSSRPYRAALRTEEAIAEIRRCAGSQFDPEVVAAFCDAAQPAIRDCPGGPSASDVASRPLDSGLRAGIEAVPRA